MIDGWFWVRLVVGVVAALIVCGWLADVVDKFVDQRHERGK